MHDLSSNAPADAAPGPIPEVCTLNDVQAGTHCRIKQLNGSHEVSIKLRELGFCEEQRVKLLLNNTNTTILCQVCNARIGLSSRVAETIVVEKLNGAAHPHP